MRWCWCNITAVHGRPRIVRNDACICERTFKQSLTDKEQTRCEHLNFCPHIRGGFSLGLHMRSSAKISPDFSITSC